MVFPMGVNSLSKPPRPGFGACCRDSTVLCRMMAGGPEPFLLAVDDYDEDLFLFGWLLRRSGAPIGFQSASGFQPAVALLSAALNSPDRPNPPVACFVDIKMPEENGFDLVVWIREQPQLASMPVIMLSSSDDASDLKRAAELGVQCFLTKFPPIHVLAAVVADAHSFPENPHAFAHSYNLLPSIAHR